MWDCVNCFSDGEGCGGGGGGGGSGGGGDGGGGSSSSSRLVIVVVIVEVLPVSYVFQVIRGVAEK